MNHFTTRSGKIAGMFSSIAKRYDFLNLLFSFGLDSKWRQRAVSVATKGSPRMVLDIASGTGKVAFETIRQSVNSKVFALDPSVNMLKIAKKRWSSIGTGSLHFIGGVAEMLPFKDGSFDAVTVAFGIRNFADLKSGLSEILRVLKPSGLLVILEFSMPDNLLLRYLFNLYLGYVIPILGWLFSKSRAYFYLRDTIKTFPRDDNLKEILESIGFVNVKFWKYTTGVVACYKALK